MNHVMIDLETLGTGVDCAVLSCGVVQFDPDTGAMGAQGYVLLNMDEQFKKRKVDAGTIRWWLKQAREAQVAAFEGRPGDRVLTIAELHAWLVSGMPAGTKVWSQGANFDVAILDHMFRTDSLTTPWKYHAVRDTRTVYDWLPESMTPKREGTHHNALDDAIHQARCVTAAYQRLRACAPQPTSTG